MKPFDLQAALAGKPVVTRGGQVVQQIHHLSLAGVYSVCGVINYGIKTWKIDGGYLENGVIRSDYDLFMVPVTRECWVNLYESMLTSPPSLACVHRTEKDADLMNVANRITGKAFHLTWEE